ncbi:MAG: hypothetical protein AABX89_01290 [Candidatus Thermoplasmatota archaeon]
MKEIRAQHWRTVAPLLALYAVALAIRLWVAGGQPYGDEAAHYYVARHLGAGPTNVFPPQEMEFLFWQRPFFSLLLWPGAQFGFEAYRLQGHLVSALLPVLVALLVRSGGGRVGWSIATGLVAAAWPPVVLWSVRVFPDPLLAALVLLGLLAWRSGRIGTAAALFLAATWVKEVGYLVPFALFATGLVAALRTREASLWPLRLNRPLTALAASLVLGPLPLLYDLAILGGPAPGWSTSPLNISHLDGLFFSVWLIPLLGLGLRWPTTRNLSAVALLYPGFYILYSMTGRGIEAWYMVLPSLLVLAAASLTLHEASTRVRPALRAVPAALVAVALLVAFLPSGTALRDLATPASPEQASLSELADGLARDTRLTEALDAIPEPQTVGIFSVDMPWFYVAYPLTERFAFLGVGLTVFGTLPEWRAAFDDADWTVVAKNDAELNRAIRAGYADCLRHDNPDFAVFETDACPRGFDAVEGEMARLRPLVLSTAFRQAVPCSDDVELLVTLTNRGADALTPRVHALSGDRSAEVNLEPLPGNTTRTDSIPFPLPDRCRIPDSFDVGITVSAAGQDELYQVLTVRL